MKKIWVVVVNFNGGDDILRCLESVKDWPVVVVDNNSSDGSLKNIKYQISNIKNRDQKTSIQLIENKKNLGFAGGVNKGVKEALKKGAEYVLLLNQDAVVRPDTIETLVRAMEKDEKIGIGGPLILTAQGKIWSAGGEIDKIRFSGGHLPKILKKDPYEVDFVSGCAMVVKKEVFEKIGFFDERFFLYYEDVDFCYRARQAGFKAIFVPQAIVDHHFEFKKMLSIRQYYLAKNRLLFLEKFAPFKIKLREIVRLPRTIYEHSNHGERQALQGIRDYFLRRFS